MPFLLCHHRILYHVCIIDLSIYMNEYFDEFSLTWYHSSIEIFCIYRIISIHWNIWLKTLDFRKCLNFKHFSIVYISSKHLLIIHSTYHLTIVKRTIFRPRITHYKMYHNHTLYLYDTFKREKEQAKRIRRRLQKCHFKRRCS